MCWKNIVAGLIVFLLASQARALTIDELAQRLQRVETEHAARITKLEQENERLRAENEKLKAQVQDTQQQVETTTASVEAVNQDVSSLSTGAEWAKKTSIGGYGELHYNNLSQEPGEIDNESFREADFHRFVIFFDHEFTDRLRFMSEVEIEHVIASSDDAGEVELEQAYLEYDVLSGGHGMLDHAALRGGLFLIPVGILNETHEPPTFYGVERNEVETVIIPATWWEGGFGGTLGFAQGFSVDLAVTTGLELPGTGSSAFRIRSGRNKVSEASADDLAYTMRLKYTGLPGLEVAGSVQYQSDMTQSQGDGTEDGWLYEGHTIWNYAVGPGKFTFKGLYAKWDIQGSVIGDAGGDDQEGWYVEPSYRLNPGITLGWSNFGDLGFYTRYQHVDGFRDQDRFEQWEVGFNYWPHEDVVLKFDYRNNNNEVTDARDYDGFDLGLGYQF